MAELTPPAPTPDQPAGSWGDILIGRYAIYSLLLVIGTILFGINLFVVGAIMPSIEADIGGMQYYSWSFSLFSVGSVIGGASAGPVRDAFGNRSSYVWAGAAMVIGLAGSALADDMLVLVLWRFVQGLGGGAIVAQSYGMVGSIYPEHLRGRILSLISTVWGVATLIGPGFGGIFAELGYWPGAFWALCALSLIVTVAAWKIIVPTIGHGDLKTIPYRRLALLAASVLTLSLTSNVDTNWARALLILFSAVLAIVAFRLDSRAEITMVPRRATSLAGQMGIAYWTLFLTTVVIVFLNVYATLFLQKLHGSTPLAAAYLSAIMSFAWTGGAFIVATWRGVLELVAIGLGLVILLIGAIGVALFVTSGPVLYLSIAFFLMGLGTGFFNNPLIQRAIAGAEEHERHIAGASVQTVRTLAIAFGASMAGIIAAIAGLGTTPEPSILAHAMNWVFGINVIFAVLAILVCLPLLLSRRHRPTPKTEAAE